ncbi:chaperone NapD [Ekhidna sp.]|uniref:chaperone NapD n=1 Tax=Ekhidna sp. TaxID=2608089 RepID=UPI003CCC1200
MPVKSYIIIPQSDQKQHLADEINKLNGCEIHPAENQEVLVLVTDTDNESEDKKLFAQIESNQNIKHISLVSGYE